MHNRRSERGSALLVAMVVGAVLLLLVAGLFAYAGQERKRSSIQVRALNRVGCAQAGLQLARTYFATNVKNWPTYLQDPKHYNPVSSAWMVSGYHSCVSTCTALDLTDATTLTTMEADTTNKYADLFYDLDGDGNKDVYIYMRDNQDEFPPATNDWTRDNDQNVIVGAVCISTTMVPRLQDGRVDSSQLTVESLLSYNTPGTTYQGQAAGGASGTGNIN